MKTKIEEQGKIFLHLPHWFNPAASEPQKLDMYIHQTLFQADACFFAISEMAMSIEGQRQNRSENYVAAIQSLAELGSMLVQATWPWIDEMEEIVGQKDDLEEDAK